MARDIESLVLRMSADLRRFEKEMARSRDIADRRLNEVERRALQSQKNLSRIMDQAGRGMVESLRSSLTALAPTLAAAFSAQAVVQYADAWTAGRNALSAAGVATEDLAARQSELVDLANETRTGAAATIALYQRLSIATAELGMSQQDTLRLTELLNKSFQSSGLSTQEAASAALQLSQALASGVLQGDELRSIRENAPQVAKAIADSMGVSIGALKDLGKEGKITAEVIVKALFGASDQINATFQRTTVTVGQALTILNNEIGRYVGRADEGLSATARLAQAIVALANNLDTVRDAVVIAATVIGTALASRAIGSAVVSFTAFNAQLALTNAQLVAFEIQSGLAAGALGRVSAAAAAGTAAMTGLRGAMAFFGGPIGLAITGVVAAVTLLALNTEKAVPPTEALGDVTTALEQATRDYEDAARAAAVATGQEAQAAREAAARKRELALAARESAAAKLAEAKATIALVGAEARQRIEAERFNFRGDRAGTIQPISPENARALRQARSDADAAQAAIDAANKAIAAADKALVTPAPTRAAKADGPGKKDKKASGPTPEELAAQRELLRLQNAIEVARAEGREEDERSLQAKLDTINLTKRLADAGVEAAEAEAAAHVQAVQAGEARKRLAEDLKKADEERADAARRENDLLLDRLSYAAQIARLEGDRTRINARERELWIEERINELLRLRPELGREAARAQATVEAGEIETAGVTGEVRDELVDGIRDGLQALVDGDMGGLFESLADRFTSRILDNLAENLADIVMSAFKGGGGGGGWMSALASVFGFRALGGPVRAGQPYIVGERRPEVFVPNVNGTIIPSVNAAAQRVSATQGPGGNNVHMKMSIDLTGANGDATIARIANDAARQGATQAFAAAMKATPARMQKKAWSGT